jgi:phosphoenolpyruvate---glycerone phosphotransferase subunit DhaK
MKKLFNSRDTMVEDMIAGFAAAYPGQIARGAHPRLVRRAVPKGADKVTLVIGNGCGHEPIAMGYVGAGMLDGNVVGDVFSAPSADLILAGLREVTGPAGTVLLISRHEGDVINGMEAAMLAADEGLNVRPLWMYDDISSAPKGQEEDRRGAAGTLFVYKILGAAAEEGMDLDALISLGEAVRGATRTLGAALSPGVSPLTGRLMFSLPEDEVFIGMGVHGEPGVGRRKLEPLRDLVDYMMTALNADRPLDRGQTVVPLINGMGGTTMMELLSVYGAVTDWLAARGVAAVSPAIGSLSTTQEMGGISISLLAPEGEMLRLWRAPQATPHFPVIR